MLFIPPWERHWSPVQANIFAVANRAKTRPAVGLYNPVSRVVVKMSRRLRDARELLRILALFERLWSQAREKGLNAFIFNGQISSHPY
jgi:hypothetical protein